MKKTKLSIEFEYDFQLFGITSSSKFHKLCWSINQTLGIRLVKKEDFEVIQKDHAPSYFIHSNFEDDSCSFSLFKNKSPDNDAHLLIPELPHFDYIIKFNGLFQTFALEELLKQLLEVKYIEYIAEISIDTIKSRDNFLY